MIKVDLNLVKSKRARVFFWAGTLLYTFWHFWDCLLLCLTKNKFPSNQKFNQCNLHYKSIFVDPTKKARKLPITRMNIFVLRTLSVLPSTFFQLLKAALSIFNDRPTFFTLRYVTFNNQIKVEAIVWKYRFSFIFIDCNAHFAVYILQGLCISLRLRLHTLCMYTLSPRTVLDHLQWPILKTFADKVQ